MREHKPALIIGDRIGPDGILAPDWTNIRETCMGCFAATDDARPGPCTQTPADSVPLTPGVLVEVRPARRWRFTPASTAVVIISVGSDRGGPMCLIWFWALGSPEYIRSVFTVTPDEVMPLRTTLATLPEESYGILAARHAECRGPAARLLAPLAEPLRRAARRLG